MSPYVITVAPAEPQELALDTTGQFEVEEVVDESTRCGPIGTARVLAYRVCVRMEPKHLDANRMVFDWQRIKTYYVDKYRKLDVFPSCEAIAFESCADIVAMVGAERCMAVEVTIGGNGVPSGMTAKWARRMARRANDA